MHISIKLIMSFVFFVGSGWIDSAEQPAAAVTQLLLGRISCEASDWAILQYGASEEDAFLQPAAGGKCFLLTSTKGFNLRSINKPSVIFVEQQDGPPVSYNILFRHEGSDAQKMQFDAEDIKIEPFNEGEDKLFCSVSLGVEGGYVQTLDNNFRFHLKGLSEDCLLKLWQAMLPTKGLMQSVVCVGGLRFYPALRERIEISLEFKKSFLDPLVINHYKLKEKLPNCADVQEGIITPKVLEFLADNPNLVGLLNSTHNQHVNPAGLRLLDTVITRVENTTKSEMFDVLIAQVFMPGQLSPKSEGNGILIESGNKFFYKLDNHVFLLDGDPSVWRQLVSQGKPFAIEGQDNEGKAFVHNIVFYKKYPNGDFSHSYGSEANPEPLCFISEDVAVREKREKESWPYCEVLLGEGSRNGLKSSRQFIPIKNLSDE